MPASPHLEPAVTPGGHGPPICMCRPRLGEAAGPAGSASGAGTRVWASDIGLFPHPTPPRRWWFPWLGSGVTGAQVPSPTGTASSRQVCGGHGSPWQVAGASPFSGRGSSAEHPRPQLPLTGRGPAWPDVRGRGSGKEAVGAALGQRSMVLSKRRRSLWGPTRPGHVGTGVLCPRTPHPNLCCVLCLGCPPTPPVPSPPPLERLRLSGAPQVLLLRQQAAGLGHLHHPSAWSP